MRTSSSQEEGAERDFAVVTTKFEGDAQGRVKKLFGKHIEWVKGQNGQMQMADVPNGGFEKPAELVLLAMGFVSPVADGMLKELGVALDPRGNVAADTERYQTSVAKVFSAGDMRRGQSLVVWAIREGRQCARAIDQFLMGSTTLPR
jgi:glutamate synthase (NADPH/NADH) small chain